MPVGKSGIVFFGLTYLSALGARTHPFEEVAAWLQDASFEDVTRSPMRSGDPGTMLVQATKPEVAR